MEFFAKTRISTAVIIRYLFNIIGIKVTYTSIANRLQKHPDFPSVKSITDTLESFRIRNKATAVNGETLKDIETPFFATTFDNKTVVVQSIKKDIVSFYSFEDGLTSNTIDSFSRIWNGLVILVDSNSNHIEKNYAELKLKELFDTFRKPFVFFTITTLIISLLFLDSGGLYILPLIFIKIAGVFFTSLLLWKDINSSTNFKFCQVGDKISCDDVLNSKASKLFDVIPMTDIGFIYFIGSLIALIIYHIGFQNTSVINILIIISFLSFSYIPFSLIYQKFVVKKWCALCLGVLFVILLENIISFYLFQKLDSIFTITTSTILIVVYSFLIPASILILLKPILSKGLKYDSVFYHRSRIINNFEVFQSIHQKKEQHTMMQSEYDILIGSNDARHKLTMVINPFCNACAEEYQQILEVLGNKSDSYSVTLRFVKKVLLKDTVNKRVALHLIDIYHSQGNVFFQKALTDWFKVKDYKKFKNTYPSNSHTLTEKTTAHNIAWNEQIIISRTPTLFFNDRKVSDHYTIDDLSYFEF